LIVGAVLGGLIGAGFGLLITLMNMGGNGNWTLAVPGAVFDGAFLGVIVGAIIRESRAKQSEQQRGRLRAILMWLAVGASLLLAWVVLVIRT